jgi:hypothetical protein
LICVEDEAVAVRAPGVVGKDVSGIVAAENTAEYPE